MIRRHPSQVSESSPNHLLTVWSKRLHLASSLLYLHLLCWRQPLERFSAGQTTISLRFWELVHLMKLLHKPLLVCGVEAIEAGLLTQQSLLLGYG